MKTSLVLYSYSHLRPEALLITSVFFLFSEKKFFWKKKKLVEPLELLKSHSTLKLLDTLLKIYIIYFNKNYIILILIVFLFIAREFYSYFKC